MSWDGLTGLLELLQVMFLAKGDRDSPELQAVRREADREAARARSRKAAGGWWRSAERT